MISKLPKWVWLGGAVLASMAGVINAVGFLSFQHQGVTHLTGVTTQLGSSIASLQTGQALHLFAVIVAFMLGAVYSGFLIRDSTLKLGRRYGLALMTESFLLFAAVPFLSRHQVLGAYLASCACGLQNAMASTYSGAVLRTTHVSGLLTDIGVFVGQFLCGIKVDWRRLFLNLILVFSFFSGGVIGALLFQHYTYSTLYFPALLTGFSGLAYGVNLYRHRHSSLKAEALNSN